MRFIDNKYSKWYFQIILNAQNRRLPVDEYSETHHIIPRSLGGINEEANLVVLTGREHFICHLLLVQMTEGRDRSSMSYAAWQMTHINKRDRYVPTSRIYEILKKNLSTSLKGKSFEERYGATQAEEIKKKIGAQSRLRKPFLGKKHSELSKQKISKSKVGIPLPKTIETRKKMSNTWKKIAPDRSGEKNPMFNKRQKESTKKLISAANSGENNGMFGKYNNAPMVTCPHCNKSGKQGPNFIRWHFENCKEKNA